jgi:hypothetical protein
MRRLVSVSLVCVLAATSLAAQKLTSVWKNPGAAGVSFAGKKVAALVVTQDDSLRVAGEEALTRELTARGLQGVAAYRMIPKEEMTDAAKAKGWFERAGVEGVVAMRPVRNDTRTIYTPSTWMTSSYSTLWGWYGYGWGAVYVPGSVSRETLVVVESLIYSVPRNELLWAAASETKNPKELSRFVEDLVKENVKEMRKQGLTK